MEQLQLFSIPDDCEINKEASTGFRDWEVDSGKKLFDNKGKGSDDGSFEEDKKLFDNTNNLSELSVSEYQPGGTAARNNKYYRFSYREGRKVKHIHIKGGNTTNPIAIKRKGLVEAWIREDVPLEKIIQWIKEW
ncbi:hypothetical protein [Crocosphaera sp.]|uniref:hypothetical protein n=1 Tax=Crocosphaera sp. TaxID=2729996 RepID=UPI00263149BC|nr:hypothetical protein [Crocosphaera sp.]MDJ0582960.1 hypothetical protein [Crocosphaera sp.]